MTYLSLAFVFVAAFGMPTAFAADVGVSVTVAQPGFYGRINVGELPSPQVVYAEPIVVNPMPPGANRQPIYLRVPPGHAKNWRKHCARYNACGQPVYFVEERWYNDVYIPHYRQERFYDVPLRSVRAVRYPTERRCWVERQQVVEERSDGLNVPGAIVGAVVGGVVGHQFGSGRGKDVATAGGAVAGAAIGANVGRGGEQAYSRDVQRCVDVQTNSQPEYWEATYEFRGVVRRAQLGARPGRTITVDINGEPRL